MVGFSRKQEMDRLTKDQPPFDDVLNAIGRLQNGSGDANDTDLIWRYYYPLCLRKGWEFFPDDEDARDASLAVFVHWKEALLKYNEDKAKVTTYFDRVVKNFFIDFTRTVMNTRPDIMYAGAAFSDEEQDAGLDMDSSFSDLHEYPYDGISDAPEVKLMETERVEEVRAGLFPADREVFDLLVEGYTSEEVAEALGRTEKGISMSIQRIKECASEE
jgi:RNA polymerase sigma factor (sigma-70 family)